MRASLPVRLVGCILWIAALVAAPSAFGQSLDFVEYFDDATIGSLDSPRALAVSPDGKSVYVTSFFGDSLTVFSRDVGDGSLTFVEAKVDGVDFVDGLDTATGVAVSPDGASVYATSFGDAAISVFERDPATSALTFLEVQRNLAGPVSGGLSGARSVVVSPDGAHVYATGSTEDTVAIFSRDGATGRLTFVDYLEQGQDGVEGILGAFAIAASSDGKQILVAGPNSDSVAVFDRDAASGLLAFAEAFYDGVDDVDGLEGARDVELSPDGDHVYVASPLDSAIAIFSRDAEAGSLSFQGIAQNGFLGVDGLLNARGVAVGAEKLFAVGFLDDAVVAFARDDAEGCLTFVENERDGENGVEGLDGATAVAVSTDESSVYTVAELDNALAVFVSNGVVPPPPPPPPAETPDLDGETITYQWRFPETDGMIIEGPRPTIVGDGIEMVGIGAGNLNLDLSATNLRLAWTGGLIFSGAESNFNGHIYSDGSGLMAPFESVAINPATNLDGFEMSRVTFDDDNIWVDFSGLGGDAGTVLSLDIALVPEPASGTAAIAVLLTLLGIPRLRRVA